MADEVIKKFRIPIAELPPISSETEGYSLRYRFISTDKNRTSYWSPLYLIQPDFNYYTKTMHISKTGDIAQIAWDSVLFLKNINSVQDISNKQLTSKVATLTTTSAHFLKVEDWVTIEGVDATFNGTYQVSAVTQTTFSYYKDTTDIVSTPVSPKGTYKKNSLIRNATEYDIWVRWGHGDNTGDWIYKERLQSTSLSLPVPTTWTINGATQSNTPNRLSVQVFLKGYPISRDYTFLKVYEQFNFIV